MFVLLFYAKKVKKRWVTIEQSSMSCHYTSQWNEIFGKFIISNERVKGQK